MFSNNPHYRYTVHTERTENDGGDDGDVAFDSTGFDFLFYPEQLERTWRTCELKWDTRRR